MQKNFCNLPMWQRANIQNLQRTQTNIPETNKQTHSKVDKGYEQTLFKRRHIWGQQTWKKCSSSLVIREMQTKTKLRYHLMPVRMKIIRKSGHKGFPRWHGRNNSGLQLSVKAQRVCSSRISRRIFVAHRTEKFPGVGETQDASTAGSAGVAGVAISASTTAQQHSAQNTLVSVPC